MDLERLRHKGWSEAELERVRRVVGQGTSWYDHLLLWLLVVLLVFGGIGVAMLLLPIFLFASLLSIPLGLLLGMCLGLMLTHALRSLRIQRQHHVRAFLFLVCVSFISTVISVHLLGERFRIIGGEPASVLFVCVPVIIGMIAPYVLERRIHGSQEQSSRKTGGLDGTS